MEGIQWYTVRALVSTARLNNPKEKFEGSECKN